MDMTDSRFCENPFISTPDSRVFSTHRAYQQTYASLLAGIRERKGFLLFTGANGIGKTTLLSQLMKHDEALARCLLVDSTPLANATFADVLRVICTELGLPQDQSGSLSKLQAFSAYVMERSKEGGTVVLLIDEAHHLSDEALGKLRMLSPLDTNSEKLLLQIVLVGPPQLEEKLFHPKLRHIRQRIALQCRLGGLEEQEVALFIHHRLRTLGDKRQDVFAPEALQRIAAYSKGVPQLINIICDKALLSVSEASPETVSVEIIDDVARTLQLLQESASPMAEVRAQVRSQSRPQDLIDASSIPTAASRPPSWGVLFSGVTLLVCITGGLLYYYRRPAPRPALAPPAVLEITRAHPTVYPGEDLVVKEGQPLAFALETTNPQPESLQYVWFLNGREQARGPHWTYEPQFEEGGPSPKDVTVRVTDRENQVLEHSWQVQVQDVNRPPKIAAVFPSAPTVEMTAGQEQRFSLEAIDPDTDDHLTYAWSLDGTEVAHSQSWAFTPAPTATKSVHSIVVAISDKAGRILEQQWTVAVAPVSLPPPQIARATPTGKELTVAEGAKLAFAVEAASVQPEPLQYVWLLDGQTRARGPRWTYQPGFDEGGTQPKVVTVRVSDREQHTIEQTWRLSVQDVNRAPIFTTVSPAARTLTLSPETEQSFSIQATDPDQNDTLLFVWSLDGREVARGQNWRFRAPPTFSMNQPHQVQIEVADSRGLQSRVTWNIMVTQPALPPRILAAQPADEQVVLQAGKSSVFAIRAEQPNAAEAPLRYEWKLNDTLVQTTSTGRFQLADTPPGHYQLTAVAVSREGLKSAPQQWTIDIRPPAPTLPSTSVAARPPTEVSPPRLVVSHAEVRTWLEAQRQALEERNVDRLVELGVMAGPQAERARNILSRYASFRVTFQNVEIQISADRATASFSRIDTIDGQTVPHADRKVFIFKRGADGHLTVRPQ